MKKNAMLKETHYVDESTVNDLSELFENLNRGCNTCEDSSSRPPEQKDEDVCVICMGDELTFPMKLKCGHIFCEGCLAEYNKKCYQKCPTCGMIYGEIRGNQPQGTMNISKKSWKHLPGYENCGTLEITYFIYDGIQNENHPNPGLPFDGTLRSAYLPDNKEGREVAEMLERAFEKQLVFTIGRSQTNGRENVVVWNDIHHKTSSHGEYGYPDPGYLKRVKEELSVKGVFPQ